MKKLLLYLVLLIALCQVYSQNYDLIIKSNGDSIACYIDSISDTHIYFEMISNKHWTNTSIRKTDVSEYMHNVINKKQYVFKPGTSIIKYPKHQPVTMRDIQKNSVYAGIFSISYSRMIPGDRIGVTFAGGLSFIAAALGGGLGLMVETTLLTGGIKHFFEPGIMVYYDSDIFTPMIRTGYRYQGPEGFLFRAAILFNYIDEFAVLPAISVGYSF